MRLQAAILLGISLVSMFICTTTTVYGEQQDWPSESLRKEFSVHGKMSYAQFDAAVRSGPPKELATSIWGMANSITPVDDRAYLVALFVDLYNAMPDGIYEEPPGNENHVGDAHDHVNDIEFATIKRQLWFQMVRLFPEYRKDASELELRMQSALARFPEELHYSMLEVWHIQEFFRDKIESGEIVIGDPDEQNTLLANNLDVSNPSYYPLIKEYMEASSPAISSGVPPWNDAAKPQTSKSESAESNQRELSTHSSSASAPADVTVPNTRSYQKILVFIFFVLASGILWLIYNRVRSAGRRRTR